MRQFLLYTGQFYCHDNSSSPDKNNFKQFAKDLLEYFVESFQLIYGKHYVSYNIHAILHLVDDYEQFGTLVNCSAFCFENFMASPIIHSDPSSKNLGANTNSIYQPGGREYFAREAQYNYNTTQNKNVGESPIFGSKNKVVRFNITHCTHSLLIVFAQVFSAFVYIKCSNKAIFIVIMWAVVHFFTDDSVEVVPKHWFKDQKCAWPIKSSNVHRLIEKKSYCKSIGVQISQCQTPIQ
ncbi:hypothetical protein AGLY_011967 [Aphis glycines]|uniref:DUF4218 domain-containing protein n=1 Tax=Aphis glycines TaxID=307491 RepID=A0A6G0TCJ6_APHGL|nr:hypothetical protein AGLY_011967 [Aphis glycines]